MKLWSISFHGLGDSSSINSKLGETQPLARLCTQSNKHFCSTQVAIGARAVDMDVAQAYSAREVLRTSFAFDAMFRLFGCNSNLIIFFWVGRLWVMAVTTNQSVRSTGPDLICLENTRYFNLGSRIRRIPGPKRHSGEWDDNLSMCEVLTIYARRSHPCTRGMFLFGARMKILSMKCGTEGDTLNSDLSVVHESEVQATKICLCGTNCCCFRAPVQSGGECRRDQGDQRGKSGRKPSRGVQWSTASLRRTMKQIAQVINASCGKGGTRSCWCRGVATGDNDEGGWRLG